MQVSETDLPGVLIVTPQRFEDKRGFFTEVWNGPKMGAHGLGLTWLQDNQSYSRFEGTIRGLHIQSAPHAQDKLVRAVRGTIWDVAVDARPDSAFFGHWVGVELSAETGRQLFIPKGFLHGFVTRCDDCEVLYKCSATYEPAADTTVHFADPELAIDWGISPSRAILSDKDAQAGGFERLLCAA